jgi:hypothetical protein
MLSQTGMAAALSAVNWAPGVQEALPLAVQRGSVAHELMLLGCMSFGCWPRKHSKHMHTGASMI